MPLIHSFLEKLTVLDFVFVFVLVLVFFTAANFVHLVVVLILIPHLKAFSVGILYKSDMIICCVILIKK